MKAFTKDKYGGPEVLKLGEIQKPLVRDGHLLIKIKSNSANPADWHILRGEPFLARLSFGLFKPKDQGFGADFAGIVEEVGSQVNGFKVGDRVYGEFLKGGAFAEYACVPQNVCAKMPESQSFSQMAAVPIAALTALQALRDHGKLEEGESVLINGSSGGVGHFSVQIAKAFGAKVTAVCSARNIEFVKSLGADEVIAYDQTDIHQYAFLHDLVLDTHGNLFFDDFRRMGKRGVVTGFTTMGHMLGVVLKSTFSKYSLAQFTAEAKREDLEVLARMIEDRKITPHIEKTFSYRGIPEAIAYIEQMRTRGKVVMEWE